MTRPGEPHDGSGQDRLEIVLGPERLARDLLRAGGMSVEQLTTYLNDHVGGSVAALELLDHLSEAHAGTPSERLFKELRADIEQDQGQLKELLRRLGGEESSVTKAAGWLGEKLGRGKMWLDDEKDGDFRLVESGAARAWYSGQDEPLADACGRGRAPAGARRRRFRVVAAARAGTAGSRRDAPPRGCAYRLHVMIAVLATHRRRCGFCKLLLACSS